jgi:hypothetical protein
MVQFRVKFGAATNARNIRKFAEFHNAKLRFFGVKNTISSGGFYLHTKHLVARKSEQI